MSRNLTTLTIDTATLDAVDKLSKNYGLSKKDFVKYSVQYFTKWGINPAINESPLEEFTRLTKRIDSVIAIVKSVEKSSINPLHAKIDGMCILSGSTKNDAITKEEMMKLFKALSFLIDDNKKLINQLIQLYKENEEAAKQKKGWIR